MLLKDKVTLVTGGSRGIGKAIAISFAEVGAHVILTYAGSKDKAEAVAEQIKGMGCKAEAIQADAADFDKAQEVVDHIAKTYGHLDVVVNNAGITRDTLLLRMTTDQWDEVMANNLRSVFNYTKAASRYMLKQRSGVFINMSSVVGIGGNAGQANYAASKAGIIGFTKSVAKELASRGVRANAIAPGFIRTEMTDAIPEEEINTWLEGIPLKRAGEVDDIANACIFLASDMASYITGQVLSVDGGMAM